MRARLQPNKKLIAFSLLIFFLATSLLYALQTHEVEIGHGGDYDGQVAITRDDAGRMLFRDADVPTPVSLLEIWTPGAFHIENLGTAGTAGSAPVSDGAGGLSMLPVALLNPNLTLSARLGVGTQQPDSTLHILGTNAPSGGITIESSAGSQADRLAIYSSGNSTVDFKKLNNTNINFTALGGASEFFIAAGGNIGVNSITPRRKLDLVDPAAPQLRITHTDNAHYADFAANDAGDLTITPSGGDLSVAGSLNADGAILRRGQRLVAGVNLLDNPDFNIWQRNTSIAAAHGGNAGATLTHPVPGTLTLGADRWQASRAGDAMTATISRATPPATLPTAAHALKIEATAGNPCRFYIHQTLSREQTLPLRGRWVTFAVSHTMQSGTAGGNIAIYKTVAGAPVELARYTFVSTSSGWDRLAVAAQVPADAECLVVSIQPELSAAGPSVAFVANAVLAEGRYVAANERVTDPAQSSLPPLPKNPAADLAACQRYFERGSIYFTATAPDSGTYGHYATVAYNTAKAGASTITLSDIVTSPMSFNSSSTTEKPTYAAGTAWPQGFRAGFAGNVGDTIPFAISANWTAEVPEPL